MTARNYAVARRTLLAGGPTFATLLLLGLAAGCNDRARPRGSSELPDPPSARTESSVAATSPLRPPSAVAPGARRPSRRYYVASGGERCEMYWEQGEERGDPEPVSCPRELSGGERIRIVGPVCLLERHDRGHDRPVRCPASLVFFEARNRPDAAVP